MATVKAIVRTTKKNAEVNIRFRLSDGRDIQLFHSSEISVKSDLWDAKNDCIKARAVFDTTKRNQINCSVLARKQLLSDLYEANRDKTELSSEIFEQLIDEALHPEKYKKVEDGFFDFMELFLSKRKLSNNRISSYGVLMRALMRFEMYYQITTNQSSFRLSIHHFSSDTLTYLENFLYDEHKIYDQYPYIYG